MENYRSYKPSTRRRKPIKGSRVALVLPKTPRQVFEQYVRTGELPRVREAGIDASLDVPVCAFGDVDSALRFVVSVYAKRESTRLEAEKAAAEAKAQREQEMAEAYARLHNNSSTGVETSV